MMGQKYRLSREIAANPKNTPKKHSLSVFLPGYKPWTHRHTDGEASMQGANWHEEGRGKDTDGPIDNGNFY